MEIQRAQITFNTAYLSDDFGLQLAMRKLELTEEQLAEKLGRYSRGKRKGKIKGQLVWEKTLCGGWVSNGYKDGFVCRFRDVTFNYHVVDSWTQEILIAPKHGSRYELEDICAKRNAERNKNTA
jgi:hypothetical protein